MRIVFAAALTALLSLSWSPASGAEPDNHPIAAVPAIGSRVSAAPSSVTVAMKKPVSSPVALVVRDPSGKIVSAERATFASTNVATDLEYGLKPGVYTVTYRLQSAKGPEGGSFQFAYGSGTPRKGFTTWASAAEIPSDVKLPSDKDTPSATPTTPSPTPSVDSSADPGNTADASKVDPDEAPGIGWWPWLPLGVVLIGGAGAAWWRGRR